MNSGVLNLSAFMIALSDPGDYGHLAVYRPPAGGTGPVQADSKMNANPTASAQISLLARIGSTVILGNVLMIPIDGSMLYVRPMYVSSSAVSYPQLKYVMVDYGEATGFATTLGGALAQVLTPGNIQQSGGPTHTVDELLALAKAEYEKAQAALSDGHLGLYQQHIALENHYLDEALQRLAVSSTTSPTSSTTTTTTPTRRT